MLRCSFFLLLTLLLGSGSLAESNVLLGSGSLAKSNVLLGNGSLAKSNVIHDLCPRGIAMAGDGGDVTRPPPIIPPPPNTLKPNNTAPIQSDNTLPQDNSTLHMDNVNPTGNSTLSLDSQMFSAKNSTSSADNSTSSADNSTSSPTQSGTRLKDNSTVSVEDLEPPATNSTEAEFDPVEYYSDIQPKEEPIRGLDTPDKPLFPPHAARQQYPRLLGVLLREMADSSWRLHNLVLRQENSTTHISALAWQGLADRFPFPPDAPLTIGEYHDALEKQRVAAKQMLVWKQNADVWNGIYVDVFHLIRSYIGILGLALNPISGVKPPMHLLDLPWYTFEALVALVIWDNTMLLNVTWRGQELKPFFRWPRRVYVRQPGVDFGPW
ncbi:hypothetical protein XA68_14135 [Ophiocordyceps unilateralis]|uniref:Uncharacterized protein n=1 Tax=Ophiocordyceps unilateralis TaxID=268505 RepID=A0A2A9PB67_OPHUN|nr:hypothetical protein XA68_14135 [Ophiocordyceps unilateralis]